MPYTQRDALQWIRQHITTDAAITGTGGGCTAVEITRGPVYVLITDELSAPESWRPADPYGFTCGIYDSTSDSCCIAAASRLDSLREVADWLSPRLNLIQRTAAATTNYSPDALAELLAVVLNPASRCDALGWIDDMEARCGLAPDRADALRAAVAGIAP